MCCTQVAPLSVDGTLPTYHGILTSLAQAILVQVDALRPQVVALQLRRRDLAQLDVQRPNCIFHSYAIYLRLRCRFPRVISSIRLRFRCDLLRHIRGIVTTLEPRSPPLSQAGASQPTRPYIGPTPRPAQNTNSMTRSLYSSFHLLLMMGPQGRHHPTQMPIRSVPQLPAHSHKWTASWHHLGTSAREAQTLRFSVLRRPELPDLLQATL